MLTLSLFLDSVATNTCTLLFGANKRWIMVEIVREEMVRLREHQNAVLLLKVRSPRAKNDEQEHAKEKSTNRKLIEKKKRTYF
ncbi:hypothetical protein BpHYR1_030973 [Brachionus plicatilis]|uniref:Uncharacterized protein n=1 Tax=Brachionus plicatilis TaxID=10195 RepID=A0A3M7SWB4_BRAPC|nr:hypothetical protein BpHYR1_030973 [Brachionus plicatilis]